MTPPTDPSASVIIPAYNAARTLRPSLDSVFAQEGAPYEVIVVNDASKDDTETIALSYPCRVISLKSNIMAANCRNLGARHARGEILIFFDADQVMTPGTVAGYVQTLRDHPGVDAVVGSLTADTPMEGFFSKFKNFQHHFTHQTARPEGATLASGLMAIRKAVFDRFGGFEPAFAGASIEDIALGYKLLKAGHRIRFQPTIQMAHLKSYTFREMARSDILHRAIPWTGLMIRERIWRSDLNTKGGNVLSVTLAWILPVALAVFAAGWPWAGVAALLALAVMWLLNASLLGACRRQFGWAFLVRSMLYLPVMYFYHGIGLVAGVITYARGGSVARKREPPPTVFDVREGGQRAEGG